MKFKTGDLIEFNDNGVVRRGRIQTIGKFGYWINSGSMYNGSIRCDFDKAIKINDKIPLPSNKK